ncbi:MAG: serine/threonine-protein kinase [Candidatus Acidiferrales bacterium]
MTAMDPERWRRIEALFLETLEQEAGARLAFVASRCDGDPELKHEVERLLEADGKTTKGLGAAVGEAVRSFGERITAGARIGAYEIVGRIGEGGMGTVYRARRGDGVFQKDVAIKVVKRGMDTGTILRRFQRERRILARLEHPHIARVLDGGSTQDGLPYLVMEFVAGQNLLDHADTQRLDLQARLRLFLQVCDAVEHAHRNLIVHRDLKPNNILVDEQGQPRLLDFGIAKLVEEGEEDLTVTAGGLGMLTPQYASPEQVKGEPVTVASDVYALGVLLYELLTGCPAHQIASLSPAALLKTVCEDEVSPRARPRTGHARTGFHSRSHPKSSVATLTALCSWPSRRCRGRDTARWRCWPATCNAT